MATKTTTKPVATVTLTLAKETAGTYVFKADPTEPVNTVYVAKSVFGEDVPTQVTLMVTPA